MCGAFAHGAIFLVRDSGVGGSAIGFLVANRSAVVSLLSFVCLFLGFHTLGLYVHNDVMQALGSPEKQLALLPVFAEWLQLAHGSHLGTTGTLGTGSRREPYPLAWDSGARRLHVATVRDCS